MNFQKHDGENGNDKQRVQALPAQRAARPFDKLVHAPRRVEWRCRFENDADLFAVSIKRADMVVERLVCAAVALVLCAEGQEVAVQLQNMVFRQVDCVEMREYGLHDLRISGDFLFVARGEGFDVKIGEQPPDLRVSQPAAFDAGGRADALDGGHAAQRLEPLRRKRSQSAPSALELVDFADEGKNFRSDYQ